MFVAFACHKMGRNKDVTLIKDVTWQKKDRLKGFFMSFKSEYCRRSGSVCWHITQYNEMCF